MVMPSVVDSSTVAKPWISAFQRYICCRISTSRGSLNIDFESRTPISMRINDMAISKFYKIIKIIWKFIDIVKESPAIFYDCYLLRDYSITKIAGLQKMSFPGAWAPFRNAILNSYPHKIRIRVDHISSWWCRNLTKSTVLKSWESQLFNFKEISA